MRIAVANWTARRAGGIETYLGLVVPSLRRLGHDVYLWHESNEPPAADLFDGATDGPSTRVDELGTSASVRSLADWRPDALFVHRIDNLDHERALLSIAPGVFFAHAYYGTCISGTKTMQAPSVHPCARTFGPMCLAAYFPRRCGGLSPVTMVTEYRRQSGRLGLLREYEAIVTFSEHMRREYVGHGFSPHRVHRLPPVDSMQDRRDIPRAPRAEASQLAFIGRIDRLKGCAVLLEALPEVRRSIHNRLVLTVAGDGPDLPRCRAIADRVASLWPDIEIRFLGWSSEEQCAALLDDSDVFVLPSLWPEPFGLAGIEAQRRGVPVAAFAVGGIPEWLEDGKTGALAPGDPATAGELARAILRCLTSAEMRETTRVGASERALRYSINGHLQTLLPLLAEAAGRGAWSGHRSNRAAEGIIQ